MGGLTASTVFAGCLGSAGGNEAGTTTSSTTNTGVPSEDEIEEWRKEMAEKAREELQDETLKVWSESTYDADYQGQVFNGYPADDTRMLEEAPIIDEGEPWEPLKDNVEVIPLNSQDQAQTYRRMAKTGSVTRDILTTSKVPEMIRQGVPLTDLGEIPAWRKHIPEDLKKNSSKIAYYRSRVSGIFYNTETVSDPPEDILDVLDSRFSDKRIILDVSSNVVKLIPFLSDEYIDSVPPRLEALGSDMTGGEFVEALGAQDPLFGTSSFDMTQSTARGDSDITFMGPLTVCFHMMYDEGLPIAPVEHPSAHHVRPLGIAIADDAPHPAAAKLFLDYLLSNPSAQLYKKGTVSLNVDESNPEEAIEYIAADWQRQYSTFDTANEPSTILDRWKDTLGAPSV